MLGAFGLAHLANEVASPGSRPVRELAASTAQVDGLLQLGPVQHLLTAFVPVRVRKRGSMHACRFVNVCKYI